eukprot:TRINITY_DN18662_c1_g2_i1.p1 TRINITY_DN18662_c1_g2~~TRINITY_DN18662_c1_g2_i1.p1  ORF type:complete len:342 (-),score=38.19 TRINITY_DN18662_c1_g2_i1:4110-5135(-)
MWSYSNLRIDTHSNYHEKSMTFQLLDHNHYLAPLLLTFPPPPPAFPHSGSVPPPPPPPPSQPISPTLPFHASTQAPSPTQQFPASFPPTAGTQAMNAPSPLPPTQGLSPNNSQHSMHTFPLSQSTQQSCQHSQTERRHSSAQPSTAGTQQLHCQSLQQHQQQQQQRSNAMPINPQQTSRTTQQQHQQSFSTQHQQQRPDQHNSTSRLSATNHPDTDANWRSRPPPGGDDELIPDSPPKVPIEQLLKQVKEVITSQTSTTVVSLIMQYDAYNSHRHKHNEANIKALQVDQGRDHARIANHESRLEKLERDFELRSSSATASEYRSQKMGRSCRPCNSTRQHP